MVYEEFVTEIADRLRRSFPDAVSIQLLRLPRNNGHPREALCIREADHSSSPAIYLEPFWESYRHGVPIELLQEEILSCYRDASRDFSALSIPLDSFDTVRPYLGVKLINRERNLALLEHLPHRDLLDLSLVYYICLRPEKGPGANALIHREHLQIWNITPEELHREAMKNAAEKMPCKIRGIDDFICDIMMSEALLSQFPISDLTGYKYPSTAQRTPMYVATNPRRVFGASCILYPGTLEAFARRCRRNFYVLPSSIHETILIPALSELRAEEMEDMVHEVNEATLAEEEFLSNHVYLYRRGQGLSLPLDDSAGMIPASAL